MGQENAVLGEFERRLVRLGLSDEVLRSVVALLKVGPQDGAGTGKVSGGDGGSTESEFGILVARTFFKTASRASDALGTTSLSMVVMLFDLFVAFEQNRAVSVSSLCIASGAAPTTALRQIGQLEARGFVTREGDVQDRRRSFVKPTARALDLIASLVEDWRTVLRP